jgi:hypothetical protein
VKFAWKIQRDMAERGHSLESIKVRPLHAPHIPLTSHLSHTHTHIHNVLCVVDVCPYPDERCACCPYTAPTLDERARACELGNELSSRQCLGPHRCKLADSDDLSHADRADV